MNPEMAGSVSQLNSELLHFEDLLREMHPSSGEIPHNPMIDIAGLELPLVGGCGGDHIIYLDFKTMFDLEARIERARTDRPGIIGRLERNRHRTGILIADASGHQRTDALLVAMLHQAFISCIPYELDMYGRVTSQLFESLNTGFYRTVSRSKYITLIYGEISESGRFRFLSAGHPSPIVFSNYYDRIMEISEEGWARCAPLGMFPSSINIDESRFRCPLLARNSFAMNQLQLMGAGDIMLLYSDGLLEHADGKFFLRGLESVLRDTKHEAASDICAAIQERARLFAPQTDDMSYVVIKKKN